MNETTSPSILERGLKPEVAQHLIRTFTKRFEKRYGKAHLYLAYHAAFPLALTPDLLYRLWAYFPRDVVGEQLHIPWIAVADLLLSGLCTEIGQELYEMDVVIRNELLKALRADKRFGEKRVRELSTFLLIYIQQYMQPSDPRIRDFARMQRWTALVYIEPKLVASELAQAFRTVLEQNDTVEQIRLASLVNTLAEPLAEFSSLLTYVRHITYLAYGQKEGVEAQQDTIKAINQIKRTLKVRLPTLHQIEMGSLASNSQAREVATIQAEYLPRNVLLEPISFPVSSAEQAVPGELAILKNNDPVLIEPTMPWYEQKSEDVYYLSTPKSKCICPSCLTEITPAECKIISGTTGNVLKIPRNWWKWIGTKPEPLDSPAYLQERARRQCPICAYLLPYNIERVPNTITLAVVGDIASGKSHYIAAVIQQIKTKLFPHATDAFACLTPEVEGEYIREYFKPLWEKGQTIAPTQSAVFPYKPLIYRLVVSPNQVTNFIIYDTAGEDFVLDERIISGARFIAHASAFIFIADPAKMAPVFDQLPTDVQKREQELFHLSKYRNLADIVNITSAFYERYHSFGRPYLEKLPVAVMVSKSDLLEYTVLPGHNFMRKTTHENGIDLQDIESVHKEVKILLKTYQQGELLAATRRFEVCKFFATSATGESPDETGHFEHVEPNRCLDPILWILYQLGIVKTVIER